MTTLTRQEIFDAALFGIRQQGCQSIGKTGCLYNGAYGAHCAVGWALVKAGVDVPDHLNGCGVQTLFTEYGRARAALAAHTLGQAAFLSRLQEIHDGGSASLELFEVHMSGFAARYGLQFTPKEAA